MKKEKKILDCTIRDGGLVNNFYFDDEFVRELYQTNLAAGIDYMEMGYKASKKVFDINEFGKWKFCDEDSIRSIVGDNQTDMKLSVMVDVGRTELSDILPKKDSVIDLTRIATYSDTIDDAIRMVDYCKEKGYEATVNIMAVSTDTTKVIEACLKKLGNSGVDGIYLVDSYGSFYPAQIRRLAQMYMETAEKCGKYIGIHAHNNQQLAFANTIEACEIGVKYLDATVSSLGRGAGNCPMELLIGYMKNHNNQQYKIEPILQFIQEHILSLKEQGIVWGYDIPYLVTGTQNKHPRSAIQFIEEKNIDYAHFYKEIVAMR